MASVLPVCSSAVEPVSAAYPTRAEFNEEDRPVLVADLDETLVHSTPIRTDRSSFIVRRGRRRLFTKVRPCASEVLFRLSKKYDIFVFTAAERDYADQVIDTAFPFIEKSDRFYSDSCRSICGYNVKDLRILGRSMRKVVMIDDILGSAILQPANVFVVRPWMSEEEDNLLEKILPVLEDAASANDILDEIRKLIKKEGMMEMRFYDEISRRLCC